MGIFRNGCCEEVPWKPEPLGEKEPAVGRAEGRVSWAGGEHLRGPGGGMRMEGGSRVREKYQTGPFGGSTVGEGESGKREKTSDVHRDEIT